jgi:hypothetical protein
MWDLVDDFKPNSQTYDTDWPPLWSSGLVVRVFGYRSGGPGSIPGTTRFSEKKKETVVGLERGPLSLVSTTEELLDRKERLLSRNPRIRP